MHVLSANCVLCIPQYSIKHSSISTLKEHWDK